MTTDESPALIPNPVLIGGNINYAKVIVVCEPPSDLTFSSNMVMAQAQMGCFEIYATRAGFVRDDMAFITCSPPIPETESATESRTNAFLEQYRPAFLEALAPLIEDADMIIFLGKYAGRQIYGKNVKITEARGQIHNIGDLRPSGKIPVLPLLSPGNVLRRPEIAETFETDFLLGGEFKKSGYDIEKYEGSRLVGDYRWCMDLEEHIDLDNPPACISADIEGVGLRWYKGIRVLTVQLSWAKGKAIAIPLDIEYWNDPDLMDETTAAMPRLTPRRRMKLIHQLRRLTENPDVHFCGHHFKYDLHALKGIGIDVATWGHDSMQLSFVADDNMQRRSLDECVRRWLPQFAGYADKFNKEVDKSQMNIVKHSDMLAYSAGDADVTRRLVFRLRSIAQEDVANYRCYEKIQMPALRAFFRIERAGILLDQDALRDLGEVAKGQEEELRESLLQQIPGELKLKHLNDPKRAKHAPEKTLSPTRADFINDVLFLPQSQGGRGHIPIVFTDSTVMNAPEERVPSASSNDHFPYFDHDPFVVDLIDYCKLEKLRSTYIGSPASESHRPVPLLKAGNRYGKAAQDILDAHGVPVQYLPAIIGEPAEVASRIEVNSAKSLIVDTDGRPWWEDISEPSGFWQYLSPESTVHPSFSLSATVTGRSASRDPNGQNIPKRGGTPRINQLVKAYRRCFKARPGHVLLEGDLSQAELRLVAWSAADRAMLAIYRSGGDIHAATAAKTMDVTLELFYELEAAQQKSARGSAKAVNFGFIYGMWWRRFQKYAKTDYGLVLSEQESEQMRIDFFDLYKQLDGWHAKMKDFASKNGFVRSIHGALRRLPAVWSDAKGVQQEAQRQAVNSPIQRLASDIGLMAMSRFSEACPWEVMRPTGFIHDAVIVEVREDYAMEAMQALKWYLQTPPLQEWFGVTPPLPLLSDISMGYNLADMAEMDGTKGNALIEAVRPAWATDNPRQWLVEDFAA